MTIERQKARLICPGSVSEFNIEMSFATILIICDLLFSNRRIGAYPDVRKKWLYLCDLSVLIQLLLGLSANGFKRNFNFFDARVCQKLILMSIQSKKEVKGGVKSKCLVKRGWEITLHFFTPGIILVIFQYNFDRLWPGEFVLS
jgi:hypothetical protein